ncbi:SH3 domain-containing protein [Bacillus sp. SA1-12]|uniref:SH3 domain-containing protein n=1 Tax=Bacillus sp. SA1-12 TaxID=1455638 RepID=UPI000A883907|nr:SH3 domain-containing protein [Bacillus sp. SA1-12]
MLHKYCTMYICFTLLFISSFASTVTLTAANEQVTINVDLVNVRSGAGLTSSIIAKVKKGQTFDVVEKKKDWIKIKVSRNVTGWVASWLVKEKSSMTTSPSVSNENGNVVSNATSLRIRSGPGTSFNVIGVFEKGKTAQYVEKSGEWIKISYSGKLGWVASSFGNITKTAVNKNLSSSSKKTATVTASSLNIRSKPSTTGTLIGSIKQSDIVTIVTEHGNWTQIQIDGVKGWVHSNYLSSNSSPSSSKDASSITKSGSSVSGTVTATTLYARNINSLSGKIIGTVSKGMKVSIIKEENDWYQIKFDSNQTGWVAGWYISKTSNTSGTAANPSPNNKQVKIIYNGTNIRSGTSTSHSIVKRANVGETYAILDTVGNWYKINLGNNKVGYIAGWVVETNGVNSPVTKPGSRQYVKNKTIVIDPGHGGQDSGAVGIRGTLEKNITFVTAKLVYNKLKSAGANVILTRSNDTYISLNSRVSTSHYRNAEAFISIHYDSTSDRSASGTTIYYYNSLKDAPLASSLNSGIAQQSNLKDRGLKFGNFHVLRENKAPAALLELGFLSNRTEELTINTSSYQERISQGIFNGLALYFK